MGKSIFAPGKTRGSIRAGGAPPARFQSDFVTERTGAIDEVLVLGFLTVNSAAQSCHGLLNKSVIPVAFRDVCSSVWSSARPFDREAEALWQ